MNNGDDPSKNRSDYEVSEALADGSVFDQSGSAGGKETKMARDLAAVFLLNLVPFAGLGFLYASGRWGLPFLFLVWCEELFFWKGHFQTPVYITLSIFGAAIVLAKNKLAPGSSGGSNPMALRERYLPPSQSRSELVQSTSEDESGTVSNMSAEGSIRGDLIKEDSRFALSPFDEKVKQAERDLLAAQLNKNRESDDEEYEEEDSQTALSSFAEKAKQAETALLAAQLNNATGAHEAKHSERALLAAQLNKATGEDEVKRAEREWLASQLNQASASKYAENEADQSAPRAGEKMPTKGMGNTDDGPDDQDDAGDKAASKFVGSKSETEEESAIFGPDQFSSNQASSAAAGPQSPGSTGFPSAVQQAAAPANHGTTNGARPGAAQPVSAAATSPGSPDEMIATSPLLDAEFSKATAKVVASIDSVAFQTVQADSISEAARQADQLTAAFSAGNAPAPPPVQQAVPSPPEAAPVLDVGLPAQLDSLGSVPGLGSIAELGVVPGFDNSNLMAGLGTIPGVAAPGSEGGAATAPAGSGQKTGVCPKCGADLDGQFSFCLSCLALL